MAIKAPTKGAGSKLGRTETVSIRLDPRLNYLCELAARSQRRTKSSFIESMLAEKISSLPIHNWRGQTGFENPPDFGDLAEELWHVRESQRLVSLALIAPELLTFEEQIVWSLIEENGFFWMGKWDNDRWNFNTDLKTIVRDRVDDCWEKLRTVALGEGGPKDLPVVTEESGILDPNQDIGNEIPF